MGASSADLICGLVLAGGEGRRMGGRDKGWVEFDGRPLVERVVERLRPQVAAILVSANRNLDRYRALPGVSDVISDDSPGYPGPLTGVLTGLSRCPTPWMAIVPCDAPMLPTDLVARLSAAIDTAPAAYARCGDRLQPLFALLSASLQPRLLASYQQGERAMHRWLQSVGARAVDFPHDGSFANVNAVPGGIDD